MQGDVFAATERTADAAEVHAHLFRAQAETGGDLVAVAVQPLGSDGQVDAAASVRNGQSCLGRHEGLILDADGVGPGDGDGPVRVVVAGTQMQLGERILVERQLGIGRCGERLVVDGDGRQGPAGRWCVDRATAATGSPAYRTSAAARTGWSAR